MRTRDLYGKEIIVDPSLYSWSEDTFHTPINIDWEGIAEKYIGMPYIVRLKDDGTLDWYTEYKNDINKYYLWQRLRRLVNVIDGTRTYRNISKEKFQYEYCYKETTIDDLLFTCQYENACDYLNVWSQLYPHDNIYSVNHRYKYQWQATYLMVVCGEGLIPAIKKAHKKDCPEMPTSSRDTEWDLWFKKMEQIRRMNYA